MGSDDTTLRMCSEEDSIGSAKIIDPSWIREVRLVQSARSVYTSSLQAKLTGRPYALSSPPLQVV